MKKLQFIFKKLFFEFFSFQLLKTFYPIFFHYEEKNTAKSTLGQIILNLLL